MPVRSSVPVRLPREAAERRYAPEEERRGGRFPTGPCGRNPVGIGLRAGPVFTGRRGKKVRARRGTPRRAIPYRPMRPEPVGIGLRAGPEFRAGPVAAGGRGRGYAQKRNAAEGDSLQAHAAGTCRDRPPCRSGCRGRPRKEGSAPEEERRGGRFPTGPCGRNPGIGLRAGPVAAGRRGKKVCARRGTPRRAIPYRPMRPEPEGLGFSCVVRSSVPVRLPRDAAERRCAQKRNAAEGDSLQAHAAGTWAIGLRAGPVRRGCRGKKVRARRGTPRRAIPYRPMRPEPVGIGLRAGPVFTGGRGK